MGRRYRDGGSLRQTEERIWINFLKCLLLVADLRDLKSNPKAPAAGTVLESRVDRGRGAWSPPSWCKQNSLNTERCLHLRGCLRESSRHVRRSWSPGKNGGRRHLLRFSVCRVRPKTGDQFQVTDEARARHIVEFRQGKLREATLARSAGARASRSTNCTNSSRLGTSRNCR